MSSEAMQMCCDAQIFLRIIKLVISLIQWSVPLVLIVLGTIDMIKAVASGDEKVAKDVQSTFIKRLIYAAAIFLVPFFVRLILNFVNDNLIHDGSGLEDATSWIDCWNGNVSCSEESGNTGNSGNNNSNNTNNNNGSNANNSNSNLNSKKDCYVYTVKKYSCKSGLSNDCISKGTCTSSDMCKYELKFDKTPYDRIEDFGNNSYQTDYISLCRNFINAEIKNVNCDISYEKVDDKNIRCVCQSKIIVSNEIKYTSNFSSIPSKRDSLSSYLCPSEINCDGENFINFCTPID